MGLAFASFSMQGWGEWELIFLLLLEIKEQSQYSLHFVLHHIIFCLQATAVYDTEHAENIQKGQHIQPSANGYLVAPGIAPGKLVLAV